MNKDIELLKERIIAWVDERDKPYVIPLLSDLENTIHENSFENGYDMGYVNGLMVGKAVQNGRMKEVVINDEYQT